MGTAKLAVMTGYACNNYCIFCYDGGGFKRGIYPPMSTEEIKKLLEEARERGCTVVDFLGGEPTIRKDLPDLISYAKALGYMGISITTNGRMLRYMDYLKDLVKRGLNSIIFSIHGPSAEIHDTLTQSPGSFEQAMEGIQNALALREEGYEIYLSDNTVMVKQNLGYLKDVLKLLLEKEFDSITFLYPHPKGNADVNFYSVVPEPEELKKGMREVINYWKSVRNKYRARFTFRYVPLCLLYPDIKLSDELYARKINFSEKHVGPEFEDWDVEKNRELYGRMKAPFCNTCSLNSLCEGMWIECLERYGTQGLSPVENLINPL